MRSLPSPFPPAGYRRLPLPDREVVVRESSLSAVRAALATASTLHAWASREGRRAARGRGAVYEARLGDRPVAVRHYRRGGWMAPLLGDRYLDRPPRPFRELAVSDALRAAGVPTPLVVAAFVLHCRPGYRADIAVEWLEPGHDLEALLRPGAYPVEARAAGLHAAGRAAGLAHRAGLVHPDLQLANLFVRPLPGGDWEGFVLDLDRARIRHGGGATAGRALARLERSLQKARGRGRIAWQDSDRAALLAGHEDGLRGVSRAGSAAKPGASSPAAGAEGP